MTSNILIVDDNIVNRRVLVVFMKKLNLQYIEAENGPEAVHLYQSAPEQFDIVLMAISMSVMDGMSATRAIRQYETDNNTPQSYILALTRLATESARLKAWESGMDEYIVTPVSFKGLGQCLREEEGRKKGRMLEVTGKVKN